MLFLFIHYAFVIENSMSVAICFHKNFISTDVGSGPLRAERRRREARREIFTTPEHVTARRSILGPPAEGRPGPSLIKLSTVRCLIRLMRKHDPSFAILAMFC